MSRVRLQFTQTLQNDVFDVVGEITQGPIPRAIFYYRNAGVDGLGEFLGVVDVDQMTTLPQWTGTPVNTFGVPFLRHTQAKTTLAAQTDIDQWKSLLVTDVKDLVNAIQNTQPIVTTYDFEVSL